MVLPWPRFCDLLITIITKILRLALHRKGPNRAGHCFCKAHIQSSERHMEETLYIKTTRHTCDDIKRHRFYVHAFSWMSAHVSVQRQLCQLLAAAPWCWLMAPSLRQQVAVQGTDLVLSDWIWRKRKAVRCLQQLTVQQNDNLFTYTQGPTLKS